MQVAEPVQTVVQKLEGWFYSFINLIPNMALTLLLLIIFLVLGRLGSKLFKKLFSKTSSNQALEQLFSTVIYAAILSIGLFIMLGVLRINKALTLILAGIGVIGFAFQDIATIFFRLLFLPLGDFLP